MTSHPQQGESAEEENPESALESPEADSAEQRTAVTGDGRDWMWSGYSGTEGEVSEADAVEQLQEVEVDEDDYR
ncbi:hypothetical protein [Allosalinactinospora lopnorensis]|uniref:hypothetical protein n=1 Tax=Allosalinactinospora lopnorensis TaxID=1352348 RepID=UPI000623D7E6|nr:hypothetical protein [Allosalinactinospora lopnorensis]